LGRDSGTPVARDRAAGTPSDAAASTTAGTNRGASAPVLAAACRRHPNSCCGDSPCRRATAHTDKPLVSVSATIRALSSARHVRRRPAPVNTSIRRTSSVIALCSVTILSPTAQIRPQTHRTAANAKGGIKTTLTINGTSVRIGRGADAETIAAVLRALKGGR